MSRLDDELKRAFRRVEPSPGFADRVLAAAAARERSGWMDRLRGWFAFPALRWATAVALVVAVIGGAVFEQNRRERERGEAAKAEVMTALRITGEKVRAVRQHVEGIGAERQEETNGI